MLTSSELKQELVEIQSLAESKFQENVYQRFLATSITLLITISILILTISFLIRILYNSETLLGDFLLNLGTDFIGSTIIFIAFSIILKPNKSSDMNKNNFHIVIFSVLAVGIITFFLAIRNNQNELLTYLPMRDSSSIAETFSRYSNNKIFLYNQEECSQYFSGYIAPDIYSGLVAKLGYDGVINWHFESFFGQDIVISFLLNISAQFLGALIIFLGIEQLFKLFENQLEVQQTMLMRIEQLRMKIE